MPQQLTNFPPYNAKTPLSKSGVITTEAHQSLLRLYNGHPLITVDTSGGSANFPVPIAKLNQNVELTFIKISADGNVPTLTGSANGNGTDNINAPGSWGTTAFAMGTAQGSKVRLKSDGVSNWYVVG